MTLTCAALVAGQRRLKKDRGRVCGRAVVAFVAPGVGVCGLHDTVMERARTRAVLQAVRDMRELRGCPREPNPEPGDQEHEGDAAFYSDEPPHGDAEFDVGGFMDPTLDDA